MKGFSRLLLICSNIYKIIDDYEDCEEFEEIRRFFSYIAQMFCSYIERYIEDQNISLERLKIIVNCLAYKYAFYGGGFNQRGNCFFFL